MKKYLLILLLCFWASFAFADVDTIEGTATSSIDTIEGSTGYDTAEGSGVAAGASGQSFSVDFSEYSTSTEHYSGGDWVEVDCDTGADADCMTTGGGTTVDTTNDNLDVPGNEFVIAYKTQTDTINQWFAFSYTDTPTSVGIYFRSTGNTDGSVNGYCLRKDGTDDFQWRWCDGYSCSDIESCNPAVGLDHAISCGGEITGTGNDTELKVWCWEADDPPARGSWGEADCTLTANPGSAADTGKYIGFYSGGNNSGTLDSFMGGDI